LLKFTKTSNYDYLYPRRITIYITKDNTIFF
jgi:hypothetical protein